MLVYEVCDTHQLAAYYAVCADCCWAATVDLTLYIWNWPEWTKTVKLEVIEPVNNIKPNVTAADLNNFAQVLRKTRPQCLWLLACGLMLTKDTSHQTAGSFVKKKLQLWLRLACSGPLKQPCSFCRVSFPSCFSQRPGQDEQKQRQVLLKSKPLNQFGCSDCGPSCQDCGWMCFIISDTKLLNVDGGKTTFALSGNSSAVQCRSTCPLLGRFM